MDPKKKLEQLASERGLRVVDRGNGYLQIVGGPLLVNFYPYAKRPSAYVAGTTSRRVGVDPAAAIAMAFEPPPIAHPNNKDKRRPGGYIAIKKKMLRISSRCFWCKIELWLRTATIDHVIPLYRGGLDNANNRVLACERCNKERGHEMPELRKKDA